MKIPRQKRILPGYNRLRKSSLNASDDAPVADLCVVVLVQQGTHDIVDELIFAVDHVQRERGNKEDHSGKEQLAEDFEEDSEKFLHNIFRLS